MYITKEQSETIARQTPKHSMAFVCKPKAGANYEPMTLMVRTAGSGTAMPVAPDGVIVNRRDPEVRYFGEPSSR